MKEESSGEFVGMSYLTGRKIYLTPKEKAILKKQQRAFSKTILWVILVFIGLSILSVLVAVFYG